MEYGMPGMIREIKEQIANRGGQRYSVRSFVFVVHVKMIQLLNPYGLDSRNMIKGTVHRCIMWPLQLF